jgi:hypothetical protein
MPETREIGEKSPRLGAELIGCEPGIVQMLVSQARKMERLQI